MPPSSNPQAHAHRALELLSHVLYRDVILTLYPQTPLPTAFAHRLTTTYEYGTEKVPTPQGFLDDIRNMIQTLRENAHVNTFVLDNTTICLNVATVLFKLDGMQKGKREYDRDMKDRLEYRLGCVKLLQKRDEECEVPVWALDWREQIGNGLNTGFKDE